MLSIAPVQSAATAGHYYEADNYYTKGNPEHQGRSQWYGKGAAALGLSGRTVDPTAFRGILEGQVPGGPQLGRIRNGEIDHLPGVDLTFSAPKSVSLLIELGKDEQALQAHNDAVRVALDWVEANILHTRVMEGGKVVTKADQQMVAALFRHDTSRELDPQTHTHAVVANMVLDKEGNWRSVHNPALFDNKKVVGAIYRAELAQRLAALGYTIDRTSRDGLFDVREVPKQVRDAFSTRRHQIEAKLAEFTHQNAKTAATLAITTRKGKVHIDRSELDAAWSRTAAEIGFDPRHAVGRRAELGPHRRTSNRLSNEQGAVKSRVNAMIDAVVSKLNALLPRRVSPAARAAIASVAYAVDHHSQRASVFAEADVLATALAHGVGTVAITDIEAAIGHFRTTETLLSPADPRFTGLYTTAEAARTEAETIHLVRSAKAAGRIIASESATTAALANTILNVGQRGAVIDTLATRDRFVAIQGFAGVGKTTLVGALKEVAAANGYDLLGLAATTSAASTLAQEAGIETMTLQKFNAQYKGVAEGRLTPAGHKDLVERYNKTILITDEMSLASTDQVNTLVKIANTVGFPKVALVGDEKQHGSVDAGKPFAQLLRSGMRVAVVANIQRQRDPALKAAVRHAITGDIDKAFAKIGRNIIEAGDRADIASKVAQYWLRLPAERRADSIIVAPANETRSDINAAIRHGLRSNGTLTGPTTTATVYADKYFTAAETRFARNYDIGNIVHFMRDYRSLGVARNSYYTVKHVDADKGIVTLEKDGKTISWRPADFGRGKTTAVTVYDQHRIDLQRGEAIMWTKADDELKVRKTDISQVTNLTSTDVTLRLRDGREITLSLDDPRLRHIDYSYVVTSYAAQGKTTNRVIGVLESWRRNVVNQQSFYVTLSRARDTAVLFTDNARSLADALKERSGVRVSALEHQGADLLQQHSPASGRTHQPTTDFTL